MRKALPYHHKDPFDRMLIAQSLDQWSYADVDNTKIARYACKLI